MNEPLTPSQRILLWQAIEDYSGLWECPWELRAIKPSADEESLKAEAAQIIAGLISEGLVELYYCQEPYGEMTKIPESKAFDLLSADEVWSQPVKDAISVRFTATEEGSALYERQL
ncbi:hypothetical protein [Arthrobacter sp. D5-1]|uniref:hypothetical protein n=1 Tax=Arthrobacter sp. D5-1 TaxID=1477518 RepID=UPI001A98F4DF|nr:hypothetical protein [Arthrobacter sp. D5-1]QSZ47919.1 hypothetical protein AYX22_05530 [Arthrobacter sp. D5-1]